jgi:phospholipid/cholesterol/gamma-HCH transport system substrate-binding protein
VKGIAEKLGVDPRAVFGLAVIVGALLLWVMAFTGGIAGLFSGSTTTLTADFASAEDIVGNDPVRINGVQVGTVSGVTGDPDGRGATVTMELDSGTQTIYSDASASILWRTALGANDAISIDPGTAASGALGSRTIPKSHTTNQVELDQITQVLHGGAQTGLQTLLREVPTALQDKQTPAQAFTALAAAAPDLGTGLNAVRGEIQDTDLKALVRQVGQAATALNVGTGAARTQQFVQAAATTLDAAGASPTDLQNTISALARVIPQSQPTFATLNDRLNQLDPLMATLTPEVGQVAPTLRDLNPAVVNADTLLHRAVPLLHQLKPTVNSLATTAKVGVPVINGLSPSLQRIEHTVLPGLAKKFPEDGNSPPYVTLGTFLEMLSNMSAQFDSDGPLVNLTLGLEEPQAQNLLPCTVDFSGTDALVCESLSTALGQLFGGTSASLGALAQRAAGTAAGGALSTLASQASSAASKLAQVKSELLKSRPAVARYLFDPNHGAKR